MKKLLILLLAFILLFIPFSAAAYQVDANLESKFGELTVTNNPAAGIIEENNLSLKTIMLKANFNQYIFREWADYYSITIGTNLLATDTEDTEILYYDENKYNKVDRLKGETDLESFNFDVLLANYLLDYSTPIENYLILIGYEYDKYNYETANGNYYNYSTDTKVNIDNGISTHDIQSHIPYLGFIYNRNITRQFKNRFVFKFSPYAYINNSSKNIYYTYTNESKTNGNYFSLKNNVRYNINKNMYITGGVQYKTLNTNGSGSRYYYDGPNQGTSVDINSDIEFEEYALDIGIQYLF